jgi:two-component system OmpR family response regulator
MARILVVEDEAPLRADLVEYLSACGHSVKGCEDGRALDLALQSAADEADIIILDVNLPGESGFSIAGRLREHSAVGIIMMTARNHSVDRVVGLEVGADVYLVKPVDLREIEAQVRRLLRRVRPPLAARAEEAKPSEAEWGFDPVAWRLISPEGKAVKLTANERLFLSLLAEKPGQPVSRQEIFLALGRQQWDPRDRSVDSLVRRLRLKGEKELGQSLPIAAAHGSGYVFANPITQR